MACWVFQKAAWLTWVGPGASFAPHYCLPTAFYSSVHFAHAEGSREGWRWPTLPSSPAKETGYHSFRQPELVRRPGAACFCASLGRATCRSQQPFPLLTPPPPVSRLSAHRVQLLNAVIKHATCVMSLLVPVVQGHAMALNINGLSSLQVKGVIHIDVVPHRHHVDDITSCLCGLRILTMSGVHAGHQLQPRSTHEIRQFQPAA